MKKSVLNKNLIKFRKSLRLNRTNIINHILKENFGDHCIFCFSDKDITQEHILPKWMFDSSQNDFSTTTLNSYGSSYIKSTVPACSECNNVILSSLEKYILNNVSSYYNPSDLNEIMLWLEIISYKFHVYDFKLRFVKNFAENRSIPYLKNFSHASLREDYPEGSLRRSLDRLVVKKKAHRINSFVFFITKNKSKHFFHRINEFVFVESPKLGCAILYFLEEDFNSEEDAHEKAKSIIKKVY